MMFEKIKEMREYEAKTQKETASSLHVTRATYAGWECGKDIIPLRKLNDLANIYQVTIDYLVGLQDKIEPRNDQIEINKTAISENIRLLRTAYHLTQKDLAEKLNTSQSNIHKYEKGKSLITTMYAIELAKNYNYSLEKLIQKKK